MHAAKRSEISFFLLYLVKIEQNTTCGERADECSTFAKKGKRMNKGDIMSITRTQFDILEALVTAPCSTQRALQERTGYSLGTVNRVLKEFSRDGYVDGRSVTAAGLSLLEPYRVKRAIFLAAGFGTRLVPITLNTPKPLIRVGGERLIDALIDAVLAVGIEEIVVVRGYLKEQFDQLLYKYPMIRFIDNPAYNEANNISSAMCVRELLSRAYVLEADLLLYNPSIIKKYHYTSNFLGIPKKRTDDWCFHVKDGIIREQRVGGEDCYQEVGISYWNEEDGKKLARHIKECYNMPGGKERYWDQVPFVVFPKDYSVQIRECAEGDIVEIDTFRELKALDKSYNV